jgi:hypothetical protein
MQSHHCENVSWHITHKLALPSSDLLGQNWREKSPWANSMGKISNSSACVGQGFAQHSKKITLYNALLKLIKV